MISLHELEGNGVSHVFELIWISVRRRMILASWVGLAGDKALFLFFSLILNGIDYSSAVKNISLIYRANDGEV